MNADPVSHNAYPVSYYYNNDNKYGYPSDSPTDIATPFIVANATVRNNVIKPGAVRYFLIPSYIFNKMYTGQIPVISPTSPIIQPTPLYTTSPESSSDRTYSESASPAFPTEEEWAALSNSVDEEIKTNGYIRQDISSAELLGMSSNKKRVLEEQNFTDQQYEDIDQLDLQDETRPYKRQKKEFLVEDENDIDCMDAEDLFIPDFSEFQFDSPLDFDILKSVFNIE